MIDTDALFIKLKNESAGIWEWNLETGYFEFDKVWESVLGYDPMAVDHDINFWFGLLHPDESVNIRHEIFRCRSGISPIFRATHRIRKKDNSWITVFSIGSVTDPCDGSGNENFICNQYIVDDIETYNYQQFQRDIGAALSSATDLTTAVRKSLEIVMRFNAVDAGGVYLLDHETNTFELIDYQGLPEWFVESSRFLRTDSRNGTLPLKEKTVCSPEDDHSVSQEDYAGRDEISIDAVFPVKCKGILEAVLFLASSKGKIVSLSDYNEIEKIAQKISGTVSRIRAENRMRSSEEKHRILLERIESPILAVDRDMRILFCNRALEDVLENRVIIEEKIDSVFSGEMKDTLIRSFGAVLNTGKPLHAPVAYLERNWNISFSSVPDGALAIIQDITASERAKEELNFKSRFEKLLIDISTGFIEMQGNALNLGINDALMEIGTAIQADRSYLFRIDNITRTVSNTHEWCASNIEPQINKLQDISFRLIPWWIRMLQMHRTIDIPVVAELPDEASAERTILENRLIQSMVGVPILHGNDLIGFLGFDSVHRERIWSKDIIDLLRIVGDAMGNALERNRMEIELRRMYHKADEEARMNTILLKEVNHRVKNNLSEIIGLLYAQMRYAEESKSISDFVPSLIGRVQGLATVHSMLSESGWKPLKIAELARQIISNTISVKSEEQRVFSTVSDSDIKVNSNQAHSLALIFNELVRNSIKYAFKEDERLRLTVKINLDESGRIVVCYRDNGRGFPERVLNLKHSGLGIDIIRNMVLKNLQGELSMQNDDGAVTTIIFTLIKTDIERTDHD